MLAAVVFLATLGNMVSPQHRGLWVETLHLCRDSVAQAYLAKSNIDEPILDIVLTPSYNSTLEALTQSVQGRQVNIVLNGKSISKPTIYETIQFGRFYISGASPAVLEAARATALAPC